MNERDELREINSRMAESIQKVEYAVARIETALVGDKFNDDGIIKRLNTMESKLKQLDKYMWMLVGMFSLGTIPIGAKVLPLIKDYLK